MQILFSTKQRPEDFADKNGGGVFPGAPRRCPFGDCNINLEMSKHGFYSRCLITPTFCGIIRIRRYKCRKCGRTVSMLPSFCLARYTYSVEFIFMLLWFALGMDSIKKAVEEWSPLAVGLSRRHIALYLGRLRKNRRLIQYGLNQISPDNISLGDAPGDTEWTKRFLFGIRPTLSPEFNAIFQNTTGKSFMSSQNRIA
jgi:hypothetical protein